MRIWSMVLVLLALFVSGPLAAQGSVTCESREGGYRECYSGFRGPPVLVRQLSNSSCVEGRSWGHRPGAIWVSQGCRGIFEEGRGSGHGGEGIVCESRDNRYNECPLRSGGPVELVEQYSGASCVEGRSWGRKRGVIWVDRGCRGLFAPYYGGGGNDYDGGGYWEQQGDFTIQCESKDNRYRTCSWDWNAGTPYLLDQLSNNPCVKGRSWGYDSRQQVLWVDQGCRAVFGGR